MWQGVQVKEYRSSLYYLCNFPKSLDYYKIKNKTNITDLAVCTSRLSKQSSLSGSSVPSQPSSVAPSRTFPEKNPYQLLLRQSFCDHRPLELQVAVCLESQEVETPPGHSANLSEHFLPVGFPLWRLETIVPLLALSREEDMTVLLLRCERPGEATEGRVGNHRFQDNPLGC